ncbi:MAG: Asp23/Gls24 family envelope stress response protein [Coriobacteriia bacterium]|nr:MAG: Asp23/Gls24 family envelope stress response protein [Coriobacteriia bacterium]HJJ00335.1 Asp23/Gls24 family envelope stress response protein [Coriobacteriaceae bacterium]
MKEIDQGYVIDGITIAPGVVETIISLAAAEVPGVAGVGTAGAISTIRSAFNAGNAIPTNGIRIEPLGDKQVAVTISIQAYYGYRLVEIAENVRKAIVDALAAQIGVTVTSVDVHVDALSFEA